MDDAKRAREIYSEMTKEEKALAHHALAAIEQGYQNSASEYRFLLGWELVHKGDYHQPSRTNLGHAVSRIFGLC